MKYGFLLALGALPACDALPRDPAGTSQRIAEPKAFTVGPVEAGLAQDQGAKALIRLFLEHRTGARLTERIGRSAAPVPG